MLQAPMRHARRGFTLTELVIVVAVIGVVTAIGAPALWEIAQEIKLKQASRELITAMRSARFKAISEVRDYGILARFSGRVEVFRGNDPATSPVTQSFELPAGVVFQGPTDPGPGGPEAIGGDFQEDVSGGWVIFRADGSADQTGAMRLYSQPNGHFREVQVSPATTARMMIRSYVGPGVDDWKDGG